MYKTCWILVFFQLLLFSLSAAENKPVVNWGADFGSGFYRGRWAQKLKGGTDLDQDGQKDDAVSYWDYSLKTPLNPPGLTYDTDAPSAIFYGGLVLYTWNNPKRGITEGHFNTNHEYRDDLNFMSLPKPSGNEDEMAEGYCLLLWKKENFLNSGAKNNISFDQNSKAQLHISRYWGGVNTAHLVVRDGDQLYVSQATFGNSDKQYLWETFPKRKLQDEPDKMDGANNPVSRKTHTISPGSTKWAEYTPKAPYDINFDFRNAKYAEHKFSDITAVGFLVCREKSKAVPCAMGLRLGEIIGVKFTSFRVDAKIADSAISPNIKMKKDGNVFIAEKPVSYGEWQVVKRNNVSNQLVNWESDRNPAYTLERGDGVPLGAENLQAVSGKEPVVALTYLDAIAFCNMLSELENLEPCYYADAEFKKVLRKFRDRDHLENQAWKPEVFWKKDAEGYRLPTSAESAKFAKNEQVLLCPVKTVSGANPDLQKSTANSGFFVFGEKPKLRNSQIISKADLQKLVKEKLQFKKLPVGAFSEDIMLSWNDHQRCIMTSNGKGKQDKPKNNLYKKLGDTRFRPEKPFEISLSTTEIPYSLWLPVRHWAEKHGYEFDYPGDMGSLAHEAGKHQHQADEPVTMISWQDAIVWCNALSEIMGLKPVYYADPEFSKPMKKSTPFRVETHHPHGYPEYPFKRWQRGKPQTASWQAIYVDPKAKGYRLPIIAESIMATEKISATVANSGKEWVKANAKGKTHPVGTSQPQSNGLYDMQGNVVEWTFYDPRPSFGMARRLGHFAKDFGKDHPSLDLKDSAFAGRSYCGFRVVK